MKNGVSGYAIDLNNAKLSMRRIWGSYTTKFHEVHGLRFWTVTYYGCTIRNHVRVVFQDQPTYGQYLMVMSVYAKPDDTAFVLCENISKLTMWSDK